MTLPMKNGRGDVEHNIASPTGREPDQAVWLSAVNKISGWKVPEEMTFTCSDGRNAPELHT